MENSTEIPRIIPLNNTSQQKQTIPQKIDTIISGALQGVIGSNKTLSLEAAQSMLTLEELRARVLDRQIKCSA